MFLVPVNCETSSNQGREPTVNLRDLISLAPTKFEYTGPTRF